MSYITRYLHSLRLAEGANFIVDLAAVWVDRLVDRRTESVSKVVRTYIEDHGGLSRNWDNLPEGERYWRALFSKFHWRVRHIKLDIERDDTLPQLSAEVVGIQPASVSFVDLADYLCTLSIGAALEWLETLV
jgi:hypothetical protein